MSKRKLVSSKNFKPGFEFNGPNKERIRVEGDIEIDSKKGITSCTVWILNEMGKKLCKTCKFFETTSTGMVRLYKYADFSSVSV